MIVADAHDHSPLTSLIFAPLIMPIFCYELSAFIWGIQNVTQPNHQLRTDVLHKTERIL